MINLINTKNLKLAMIVSAVVLLTAKAQAATPIAIQAKCTVVQISNEFSSYMKPKVGDIINIDTRQPKISNIEFQSRNMIPLLKPLQLQAANNYTGHMAVYVSEYTTPVGGSTSTVLQLARLSNNQIQVIIQQISRGNFNETWSLSQMLLRCR